MHPAASKAILLDLPGLLFFSTYTLLVLFWAEIYHQARSLPASSLRPAFLGLNAAVYAVQARPICCLSTTGLQCSRVCRPGTSRLSLACGGASMQRCMLFRLGLSVLGLCSASMQPCSLFRHGVCV